MPDLPADWYEPISEQRKQAWRSVSLDGRAPHNSLTDPNHIRPMQKPVWEGTPVIEKRPGGFEIPLVHDSAPDQPITAKQYANKRGHYDQMRKRIRTDPTIFKD